jgi:dihydrofolate synthase/folylpolyglutamate synthase
VKSYQETLDYIYSFVDPQRKPAASPAEAARHTQRTEAFLTAVGGPQHDLPAVVVAGTKGKGSSVAMIEAMVRASGLRVGLFTSPHLSSYRERIQINRELISREDLSALVQQLRPQIDDFAQGDYGRPHTFDVSLLLALSYFVAQKVDLAVLEIGLGGRFDSVNVVTPLVSAISSISYDHMAILGHSLSEIAWNKAGIIKPGVPVVSVPQAAEAAAVIAAEAHMQHAPLWQADPDGLRLVQEREQSEPITPYPVAPRPALRGAVQVENARLALGVTMLLRRVGLNLPASALAEGLASVSWPGRFELIAGSPPILIDGAHNGDSAHKLSLAIRSELPHERMILLLGTSRDKDIAAISAALVPSASAVILTRSAHTRAMDLNQIADVVKPYLQGPLLLTPDVATALATAQGMATANDLIVITGSLFVVAEAREALGLAQAE